MIVDKCLPLSGLHYDVGKGLDSVASRVPQGSQKGRWFGSAPAPTIKECIDLPGVKGTGLQGERLEFPLSPSHSHCSAQGGPQGPGPQDFLH